MNHNLPSAKHTATYTISDIASSPSVRLSWEGLILIALLCGNDYHPGVSGCGMKSAVSLAHCGFGEELLLAFKKYIGEQQHDGTNSFTQWLVQWRTNIAAELSTNTRGYLVSKQHKLSKDLLGSGGVNFPDIPTLTLLVYPVTSQTDKRFSHQLAKFSEDRDPDLAVLGRLCETYFAWGSRELIIKKYVRQLLHLP